MRPRTLSIMFVGLALAGHAGAEAPAPAPGVPYHPAVEPASDEAAGALATIRVPGDLKIELYAAEPLLANPVAFAFDETGKCYVAETFRHSDGATDNRSHMVWLDDDLAARTVDDRVAMYRKHLGADFDRSKVESDRVRLVEDRDGDGKADHSEVFAEGFNEAADGIGAGVIARRGDVWYTCIPKLWKLRDVDGDGKADERKALQDGYGVHVSFIGHDLHGLRFGPDGKLYFSIGDRGLNVRADGKDVVDPDTGSVLRCDPDGSNLETFATGLRNPQELAFDKYGNLFTGDNNSDSGDKARWVYLVEGGDSGWRIGYQYIEGPTSRGPWNAEKLWHPQFPGQAAYIIPPVTNLGDGPSGLTYNPGVGLPDRYKDHFFLADFRGSSGQSGIRTLAVKPKGASFEVVDSRESIWSVLATDVDFGPDGALYILDWVEGWAKPKKGRIWRVSDPSAAGRPGVAEVKDRLARGFADLPADDLARLLGHEDMRIRQGAQFALVDRGAASIATLGKAARGGELLARLHAIWGLGQVGRKEPKALETVVELLDDGDAEVRAQALRVAGDGEATAAFARALALLADPSARVRSFAGLALAKIGKPAAIGPVLTMLREANDADPVLRHAGAMALAGSGGADALVGSIGDASPAARMGILLALRKLGSPEVARFLDDADPQLVVEAARAIHDVPIEAAMPRLAALAAKVTGDGPAPDEALLRRILNANVRVGGTGGATALAMLATADRLPLAIRVEALDALTDWAKPTGRDRVLGLWRPLPERPAGPAAEALGSRIVGLLGSGAEGVRGAAARAAGVLGLKQAGPALAALVAAGSAPVDARVEALKALERLGDPILAESAERALADGPDDLADEGLRLVAKARPERAVGVLGGVLRDGSTRRRQAAYAALGALSGAEADAILSARLDDLAAGKVPAELELDLLQAAGTRKGGEIASKVARFDAERPAGDPLAGYRESLAGGSARRGRKVFMENTAAACLRCHKAEGKGGEVGPAVDGIADRRDRRYLLEALVAPDRQIAEGFETTVVAMADGRVHSGIAKGEDDATLRLITADGKALALPKAEIEERKRGASAMPSDIVKQLNKGEIRDLVEYLSTLRAIPKAGDGHGPG